MNSKKLTKKLLIFYIISLTWIVLMKMEFSFKYLPNIRNINLIPFYDSAQVNGQIDVKEIYLNLLAFVPYGILMEVLKKDQTLWNTIKPIFLTSLSYEVVQYIFGIGASDITDLLMNTTGGLLGIYLTKWIYHKAPNKWVSIINTISLIVAILLTTLILVVLISNGLMF